MEKLSIELKVIIFSYAAEDNLDNLYALETVCKQFQDIVHSFEWSSLINFYTINEAISRAFFKYKKFKTLTVSYWNMRNHLSLFCATDNIIYTGVSDIKLIAVFFNELNYIHTYHGTHVPEFFNNNYVKRKKDKWTRSFDLMSMVYRTLDELIFVPLIKKFVKYMFTEKLTETIPSREHYDNLLAFIQTQCDRQIDYSYMNIV